MKLQLKNRKQLVKPLTDIVNNIIKSKSRKAARKFLREQGLSIKDLGL